MTGIGDFSKLLATVPSWPFCDLWKTAHAVIAIENVRLFTELASRTAENTASNPSSSEIPTQATSHGAFAEQLRERSRSPLPLILIVAIPRCMVASVQLHDG